MANIINRLRGMAGSQQEQDDPVGAMLLTTPESEPVITDKDVQRGAELLARYKDGKSNLERRIVDDELWYKIRHWEVLRRHTDGDTQPEPSSAWLFNALANKHADAMDNFPRPNVLPRERGDEQAAQELSSVLPCVLELCEFEQTYSDNWWEKLKHGTAVYFVGWDKDKENGLGDVDVSGLDLLNIFWEPGISDIQNSRNVFIVDLVDNDLLREQWPQLKGRDPGDVIDVTKYVYDDAVDTSDKSLVVDWYYKIRAADGRQLLHMVKFAGSALLYASQNDPELRDAGLYEHGLYPVVFDSLYPEKGTPVGFGVVSVCRDPQLYIDKLGGSILRHAEMAATPRYYASRAAGINKKQFLDWKEPIVDVEGSISEDRLQPIIVPDLDSTVVSVLQMKIDELKETSSNRDVNSGAAGSGVTAAAAISALQEAGNKNSRDSIAAAYRAYKLIGYMCVELIRQFYDVKRTFRITGQASGEYQFAEFSNAGIRDQQLPPAYPGQESEPGFQPMCRRPVFDIKISAEKKSPFSQMTQNEYAKEFYRLGFFNPEKAQETLIALDMMEFEGKEKIVEQVRQGQTLLNICQQMGAQLDQMAAIIQALTGQGVPAGAGAGAAGTSAGSSGASSAGTGGGGLGNAVVDAQTQNMTSYMQKMAANAAPNMNNLPSKTAPGV